MRRRGDESIDIAHPPCASAEDGPSSEAEPTTVRERPYQPKIAPLWNNAVTMFGVFVAGAAVLLLLTFGLFSAVSATKNPYVDIIGFLVLPGLAVVGLVIIPFGILFKSWRLRRRDPEQRLAFRFPRIDLNDPAQRRAAKIMIGIGFVCLPVLGVSSYHGYHYTDSAAFCSKACHSVMKPQATTYEHSAHARVSCAACHIGSGAGWFVKSKLSGLQQVLAMWRDSYPRPIPPAITELRPARDTCENCHWPKKFFGARWTEIVRFASDENNERREINMLLKIGGGHEATGPVEGIHAHMALSGQIEYVATDGRLQEIPWVKLTDRSGDVQIYRSDGRPTSDPRPEGQLRSLDCMDCHNRPAHEFLSPTEAVDKALEVGRIDTTLPYIKREAVAALVEPYPDVETAAARIGAALSNYYLENYPELWKTRKASINLAIDRVRECYRSNFFPDMNVDWRTYPDNIGHKYSSGCFRCHDGKHVNQAGEVISHECSVCHTFLSPIGKSGKSELIEHGRFVHSIPLEGRHSELRCDRCHTGGSAPPRSCEGCHTLEADFRTGAAAAFEGLELPAEPMAENLSCDDCHDLSRPTDIATLDRACMSCHEDEEGFEGMLASWQHEVDQLMREAEAAAGEEGRELLETLRRAGPLHNIEGTRLIIRALAGQSGPPASSDIASAASAQR